ncbi:Choline-sulfatase [Planctomycetales bacterium 10988]|nr:Choline-sulfatase [Planctomycetales bacterium 10988]
MFDRKMLLGLMACLLVAAPLWSQEAKEKPNILFIAIDDQNDWIGCMEGHPQIKTPNIDRLAARGTLFTNAHCQAPLCNPSRTSLLTGKRPSTTGIYGLAPWFRTVDELSDLVSLPQAMQKAGYTTYATGKIYHGRYGRANDDQEFQHLGPAASGAPFPKEKLVNTPSDIRLMDWGTFPHKDEDKGDYKVASWAVEQLDAKPKDPFFMAVGFFLPHVPCYVTQKWYDMYPEETLLLPPMLPNERDNTPRFSWYLHWTLPEPRLKFLQENNEWKNLVRSYLASTSFMDSQVGRVLDALDRNGLKDNTIVVLWSDHGWHIGEKLITGKNTLWDRSTNVPLVFAGPGISEGAVCGQPAELLDIYPTLLKLSGVPKVKGLEGHSLVPQLKDADKKRKWPAITTHNQGNHGIRTEKWRYIHYADGTEELYNMLEDPNEWENLASDPQYATVIKKLKAWLPKVDVPPAPGSAKRILTYENGNAVWEEQPINPNDPIPELY